MYETAVTTFFLIAIATAIPLIVRAMFTGQAPPVPFAVPGNSTIVQQA